MLAMLFGCGFRRSELVSLELDDIQMRQGHWAVVDLIGKGGHIRTAHSELGESRSRSMDTSRCRACSGLDRSEGDADGASGFGAERRKAAIVLGEIPIVVALDLELRNIQGRRSLIGKVYELEADSSFPLSELERSAREARATRW